MAEQFRARKVKKTYHALVSGKPKPEFGVINAPILRLNTGKTDEAKMIIDDKGDSAETEYRIIPSSEVFGITR